MQACRDRLKLSQQELHNAAHAGLVLRRFLQVAVQDELKKHPVARSELFATARSSATNSCGLYQFAFARWCESVSTPTSERLQVQGRLIVGLGGDNVLETGITLHHTYGMPMIPGSALKGLAAHYCDQVWGRADEDFRNSGAHHKILFGTTEDSGHIIFHDAWITPDSLQAGDKSGLVLDVMTPHHTDYYSDNKYEGGDQQGSLIPPTDFDDPTPIPFLSVAGAFQVTVSCNVAGEDGDQWSRLAFELLEEALREWGVGGKTSSGYGRLNARPLTQSEGIDRIATTAVVKQTPKYSRGKKIIVTRIEDATGKGKVKFQADDDFIGHIASGINPAVDVGQTVELWVANVSPQGYTLSTIEVVVKAKSSTNKGKGPRR